MKSNNHLEHDLEDSAMLWGVMGIYVDDMIITEDHLKEIRLCLDGVGVSIKIISFGLIVKNNIKLMIFWKIWEKY
jgi:hypothetical protein